jgi:hypothetical protein
MRPSGKNARPQGFSKPVAKVVAVGEPPLKPGVGVGDGDGDGDDEGAGDAASDPPPQAVRKPPLAAACHRVLRASRRLVSTPLAKKDMLVSHTEQDTKPTQF